MKKLLALIVPLACLLAPLSANAAAVSLWQVTLTGNWLGPVATQLRLEHSDDTLRGVSLSGATPVLAGLPGDHDVSDGLLVFEAQRSGDNSYTGTFTAPWREGALTLTIDAATLAGTVEGGAFDGKISGQRIDAAGAIRDYPAILAHFDTVMATRLFDPAMLQTPAYLEFRARLGDVVELARDDLDLLFGIKWAWQDAPFSHFSVKRSAQTAEQMFAYFDQYRVGFEAASVDFDDDIAILTVRTMMGADTIEQIDAAFDEIAAAGPRALIVDLRGNQGGAFAVKPLVEHIIDAPVDAGYFLSQVWNRSHTGLPLPADVMATPPWYGWSIVSFWRDVQDAGILRVQFQPARPNFDGPVVVLVDNTAASATELAVDALRASGAVTIIGARTAGEMLSQSMFDLGEGFIVSLPVADYYSLAHGRIEGQGVPVDIEAAPAEALDAARRLFGD